jgi:transcriptional regulator with XRE-family HTH domain
MFYFEEFRKKRKDLKLSMKDVAQKLGVGWQTIWAWENNKRSPSEIKIRNLAKALQIPINQISDILPEPLISDGKLSIVSNPWFDFIDADIKKKTDETNYIIEKIKQLNDDTCKTSIIVNSLITSINLIFYIKDCNLKYIIVNKAFLNNLSLPATYVTQGKDDYDFFLLKDARENSEQDEMVLKTGKPIINHEGFIPGTRRKKWGLTSKVPIFDSMHKISGLMCSFVHIPNKEKLSKELNWQNSILKLTDEVMWCLNRENNKFIFVSESVESVYGITRKHFYKSDGFLLWLNKIVYPSDKNVVLDAMKNIDAKQIISYRIITKSGEVKKNQTVMYKKIHNNVPCLIFTERIL